MNNIQTNSPLMIYEPFNLLVFLSFYSPVIISVCMIALSFVYQNIKGFVFFGYLLGVCVIRSFVYFISGASLTPKDDTICQSVQFSPYGNSTFSTFVFAFTITYLAIPMFTNKNVNWWVFIGLIIYFFLDITLKIFKKCIVKVSDLIINLLIGFTLAAAIISAMYAGGSSAYLFYNSTVSDNEQCSMPSNQTFKCSVYKNGMLIGNA